MTDPVLLIVDALAIFRLSRLVTSDTILDRPRNWLLRRWPGADTEFHDSEVERVEGEGAAYTAVRGRPVTPVPEWSPRLWVVVEPHWFGNLISCVWCVSVYVAVVVVALRAWWDWWQWPALVAAGSAAAGWIHTRTQ